MRIIKIEPYPNGAHANQSSSRTSSVPDGYALIPDDMPIPDTFPFVDIEVDDGTPPMVVSMTAGTVPPIAPEHTPEPSITDRISAMEQAVLTLMMEG